MTPWPEYEVYLSEQEAFDLIDELADEPRDPFTGLIARFVQSAAPAAAAPRATPAAVSSDAGVSDARGVTFLSVYDMTHRHAACHAGEPAAGRLDGRLICHSCVHGPEDENPRELAAPGA